MMTQEDKWQGAPRFISRGKAARAWS